MIRVPLVTVLARDGLKILNQALEMSRGALVTILARETRMKNFQKSLDMFRVPQVTILARDMRSKVFDQMGLVHITSWYPNFNVSHFGLPPSEIHRMTGLPPQIVWTMTHSHRPHPWIRRSCEGRWERYWREIAIEHVQKAWRVARSAFHDVGASNTIKNFNNPRTFFASAACRNTVNPR